MNGLIPELQRIIIDYLPFERYMAYKWYAQVLKEPEPRRGYDFTELFPLSTVLTFLNYMMEDEHFEIVECMYYELSQGYTSRVIKLDSPIKHLVKGNSQPDIIVQVAWLGLLPLL